MSIVIRLTQRTTQIELIAGGFVQYFDNNDVEKIKWVGKSIKVGTSTIRVNGGKLLEVDDLKFYGTCTIYFHDKPPREFDSGIFHFDTFHNSSHGIPISNDGTRLFVTSYENDKTCGKKKGLHAYDIETGSLLWRVNKGNIGNIFVYDDYLIFLNGNDSVYKVDVNDGDILGQVKNQAAHRIFDLGAPYILLDAPIGKLSIIDTETMLIVKKYGPKIVNPSNCLSLMINDVILQDGKLTISGIEQFPSRLYDPSAPLAGGDPFERVIDTGVAWE